MARRTVASGDGLELGADLLDATSGEKSAGEDRTRRWEQARPLAVVQVGSGLAHRPGTRHVRTGLGQSME
jgi:hypothetical protein